jgi:serine O-acetyltransferase
MEITKLSDLIKSDLDRFTQTFALRGQAFSRCRVFWESFVFKAGFQAVFLYRISHWLHERKWNYTAWFVTRLNIAWTGAEIEYNAHIGPGMFIAHPVGIVIGRGTVMGKNVTLFQGVSFGVKSWHPAAIGKFPRVEDNCYFFAGSAVMGNVRIGSESVVAAHAVVVCDVPEGSLAAGVPAKIYPGKGKDAIASWSRAV